MYIRVHVVEKKKGREGREESKLCMHTMFFDCLPNRLLASF